MEGSGDGWRATSSTRVTLEAGDIVDPSVDSCDLFEFSDVEGLRLDVADIDAEESARRIFQHLHRSFREGQ